MASFHDFFDGYLAIGALDNKNQKQVQEGEEGRRVEFVVEPVWHSAAICPGEDLKFVRMTIDTEGADEEGVVEPLLKMGKSLTIARVTLADLLATENRNHSLPDIIIQ